MKNCNACNKPNPPGEFYDNCRTCKSCIRARSEARRRRMLNDREWVLREAARHREKSRRYREDGRAKPIPTDKKRDAIRKHREKYPERNKARAAVHRAIASGRLVRNLCHCGQSAQAHHSDYSKQLDVQWLCPKHHADADNEIRRQKRLNGATPKTRTNAV